MTVYNEEYNMIQRDPDEMTWINHQNTNFRYPEFRRDNKYPNWSTDFVLGLDRNGTEYIVRLTLTNYEGCSMMQWQTYGNKRKFNFDDIVAWRELPENPIKNKRRKQNA